VVAHKLLGRHRHRPPAGTRPRRGARLRGSDLTLIATAISELARNIIEYATAGEIVLSHDATNGRRASSSSPRTRDPVFPTCPGP